MRICSVSLIIFFCIRIGLCDEQISNVLSDEGGHSANEVQNALRALEQGDEINVGLLYRGYPISHLDQIMLGDNDHRALVAAWKVAINAPSLNEGTSKQSKPISTHRMHRFIGYVEGRLRIDLPTWLEETLLTTKNYGAEYFLDVDIRQCPNYRYLQKSNCWLHDNVLKVSRTGSVLSLTLENESQRYEFNFESEKPTKFFVKDWKCVVNAKKHDGLYLTIHGNTPREYRINKYSRDGKRVLWSRLVWTMPSTPGFGSGQTQEGHWSEMLFTDSRVYVVGATPGIAKGVVYIEGFSRIDGQPMLRFSTQIPMVQDSKQINR